MGYVDGANAYLSFTQNPLGYLDPFGLAVGHHIVPQEIWTNWEESAGRTVFDRMTTGGLPNGHHWDEAHARYNTAVRELFDDWVRKNRLDKNKLAKLTAHQAEDFVNQVLKCQNKAIRSYLSMIAAELRKAAKPALDKALEQTAKELIKKEGADAITKRGGRKAAQILIKGALKKIPVVTAAFIIIDAQENGIAYAAQNAIVPADDINAIMKEVACSIRDGVAEMEDNIADNLIKNAGGKKGDPFWDNVRENLRD